jgi:surfeit locus 1 family protein
MRPDLVSPLRPLRIMKTKAEPKLARMAKKAIATMYFMRTIISLPRTRAFAWVTLAMVIGVALTVRLGFWQLSRAAQKEERQAAIVVQMQAGVLNTSALLDDPTNFGLMHQRVRLQGQWLPQHTVYLDNRPMNGRAGFWVITPLQLNANTRVLVQRGWVPRHQLDRTLLPEIQTPTGVVQIQGRIAPPPSPLMSLTADPGFDNTDPKVNHIRQNLDLGVYAVQVGGTLAATVLQTDANSEGLQRDWPVITAGVEKNLAYAFQWFALAALQLMLYIWFQFIQPYRHARRLSTSN